MTPEEILKKMTLADKIALCSGGSYWQTKSMEQYGIPSVFMCDGPHGLRKQLNTADMLGLNESVPATSFPTAVLSACSWDTDLLAKEGQAIAEEAAANQVGIFLGPGVCLKRNPLCGRNFEYFSEDPYLAGKLSAAYISSAEKTGIGTSLKHFACNSQENKRFSSDSVLDERTLRELYLSGFEIAVREGKPSTIMAAYNKINGDHCSGNTHLMQDILRKEWGFDGMVVTDWGAMSDRIDGFRAGCDLSMPGGSDYMEADAQRAVENGTLTEEEVDACALRVLKLVMSKAEVLKKTVSCDLDAHHSLAREIAENSAVLLKNDRNLLPLRKDQKIALIGAMAETPRYQGAGSSHIQPTRLSSLREQMTDACYVPGCLVDGSTNAELLQEAGKAAREADVAVVCVGLTDIYESEGFDRENMTMPEGHLALIETVCKETTNVVVVLTCGSVVETPWADQVASILYVGLPGQAGGEAIANLLFGKVNPSGKLAESWPFTYADCPSSDCYGTKDGQYREGIYVGYRYYDKAGVKVRWPFGYGLSYTTFSYSDLIVKGREVSVVVRNSGSLAGSDVVQMYIAAPQNGIHRPVRELKGFQKVFLAPGEEKTVTFRLDDRSFAIWREGWRIPVGTYQVEIGGQSEEIQVTGETLPIPAWQAGSWYEKPVGHPTKEQWETMLGRTYTEVIPKKGSFTMDSTPMEMRKHSLIMRFMCSAIEKTVAKGFGGKVDYSNPTFKMMITSSLDCSLSGMQINGGAKGNTFRGLLEMANGHYIRGIKLLTQK